MRRMFLAALAAVFALVALPGLAVAQVAPLDSAVGNGSTGFITFQFNVTSGPSGENPSGSATASVAVPGFGPFISTKIVCLSVSGNTATFVDQLAPNPGGDTYGKVTVVDNGLSGDTYAAAVYVGALPPTCSPITDFASVQDAAASALAEPVVSGDITVFDAPELPTSKAQCKNGGWRNFGATFKNQGDCVSFVENGK